MQQSDQDLKCTETRDQDIIFNAGIVPIRQAHKITIMPILDIVIVTEDIELFCLPIMIVLLLFSNYEAVPKSVILFYV